MSQLAQPKSTHQLHLLSRNSSFFASKPTHALLHLVGALLLNRVQLAKSTSNHSAWNSAGTWEERKIELKTAENLLKESLDRISGSLSASLKFTELKKIEGEVHSVVSRGKAKLGFSLSLEFLICEEPTEKNANSASLSIEEFSDDGDYEVDKETMTQ